MEKLGGGWVVGDRCIPHNRGTGPSLDSILGRYATRSAPLLDFSPDKAAVDKEARRRELRRKRDRGAEVGDVRPAAPPHEHVRHLGLISVA